jgi:osmotically-inducible protein OsmY
VKPPFALGRSDTDLAEDVRHALERELRTSAGRIHSTVDGGWVTLEGTVRAHQERDDAERAIRRLAGVLRVDNRILVQSDS